MLFDIAALVSSILLIGSGLTIALLDTPTRGTPE